jgi:glutamine cyclotransferase
MSARIIAFPSRPAQANTAAGCPHCDCSDHLVVYWGEGWALCSTHKTRWRSEAAGEIGQFIGPCEYSIVEEYEVVACDEARL